MKSNTKYELDNKTIVSLFEKAGIMGARDISHLGNGEFNSVYAADAEGKAYALKIAPIDNDGILSYEKNIMSQEVYYYTLMRDKAGIRVPEVYYSDFSCDIVATPFFIMERLQGTQIDQADLSDDQKKDAHKKLTAMAAQLHSVKGDQFGYRQTGLHDNWHLALHAMVTSLIEDCRNLGKNTRRAKKLLWFINLNREILEKVDCRLINFDIWPANIMCQKKEGAVDLAWIDPERCLWGDHIADFVCLDFNNMSLEHKTEMRALYNAVSDQPIGTSREEEIRYALMLGYLGVIMEVEKYARYSYFHFGYWRNVYVCSRIFRTCFKQLHGLTDK
ncbi:MULTISPECIES: phosphotransferase family protein [unclassified Oceanispirochaeta]|uniref:phosphotransferase family protein n=1 Tax=unclassified Oceanispirochaeta TaxID=2635722 RepID=UPI000E08FAFA|nr:MULTISPECIES: aminoglycoside phosphotransferase family protein [unclassified Oceanispirochaeta]MBF9017325.1 aminoglycoside phosphotransferase family protein [Oceanispirochaeta sp. M2]NPD73835.1 aminoglycoside phosphotransferase family protein [Oceanispirochaeta sp. M1]RDG30435.1 aminoglycoside phosphotransferase family protein [Oceanispirochaeta sp. M1]